MFKNSRALVLSLSQGADDFVDPDAEIEVQLALVKQKFLADALHVAEEEGVTCELTTSLCEPLIRTPCSNAA